jgi:acetyl-CoA carboxylase carboxyl transferase subunit alpha
VICIVIGEGASGGALGIGIGDRVLMLENAWYSVISPENCSTILWRSWEHKEKAAEAMKLTGEDMLGQGLIDGIIKEPIGGAHSNWEEIIATVKQTILENLVTLKGKDKKKLVSERIDKFCRMGVVLEAE